MATVMANNILASGATLTPAQRVSRAVNLINRDPELRAFGSLVMFTNIQIDSSATPNKLETLTFQVSSPGMETQTFNLYIDVVPPKTTIAENYLQVLGYAAVEITDYPNVNAVEGMVVSELFTNPSDLNIGTRPRLIPWE